MTSTPTHVKWIWKRLEGIEKFTSWINKAIYTNDQRFFFFVVYLFTVPVCYKHVGSWLFH